MAKMNQEIADKQMKAADVVTPIKEKPKAQAAPMDAEAQSELAEKAAASKTELRVVEGTERVLMQNESKNEDRQGGVVVRLDASRSVISAKGGK